MKNFTTKDTKDTKETDLHNTFVFLGVLGVLGGKRFEFFAKCKESHFGRNADFGRKALMTAALVST